MQDNQSSSYHWTRIIIVSGASLLILAFLYWNVLFVQGNLIKQAETAYMQQQIHSLEAILADIERECQTLNKEIAADPAVEKTLLKAGPQGVNNMKVPAYAELQDQYALNNLQLLSAKGRVMWSVNNPAQKGEDQSYRRSILAALQEKDSLCALERMDADLNIVSSVPVFNENKYIGSSELSMHLGKALENRLSKKERACYSIYQLNGIQRDLLWTGKESRMVINTSDIKKVQKGEAFYRPGEDKKMLVIIPLKDIDSISVAYIQGEIPRKTFLDARTNNLLFLIICTLLILFSGYLLAIPEGLNISVAKSEPAGFKDKGRINRVSIHVNPAGKDLRNGE